MAKDSFVLYKSYYEPVKSLSDKQLGKLFRALFEYQINHSIEVDIDIQMAFSFFKNQMDIDEEKYHKIVERNRKNGLKGGRGNKEETQPTPDDPKEPSGLFGVLNDNDNDNDNKETSTKVDGKKKDAAKAAALERRDEFGKSLIPYLDLYGRDMIRAFFNYWSELNKSGTKMKYELEKTWELPRRLNNWASRDKKPKNELGIVLKNNSPSKYDNEDKWNR